MAKHKYLSVVVFACLSGSLFAQMILHDPFDYPYNPEDSHSYLGRHGGWQFGYNDDRPSEASLRDAHLHAASPFPSKGTALHPVSTKTSAHKILPETLNGKTVYFSVLMKSFPPYDEGSLKGLSGIRFRSNLGNVMFAGQLDQKIGMQINNTKDGFGSYFAKTDYLLAGRLEISRDGREVSISVSLYDAAKPVPKEVPGKWEGMLEQKLGREVVWNAVELHVASSSTTFDDLRISTDWSDIAGR